MNKQVQDKKVVVKRRAERTKEKVKQDQPELRSKPNQLDAQTVSQMQRTLGNAAVQRVLAQRVPDGEQQLDDQTSQAIESRRGAGQTLDDSVAERAGSVMNADFSDVSVHNDAEADQLSRSVGAKAFTTGKDIFFRAGQYDPGSSDGQRLIAHELTHVVQQGGAAQGIQGKMTVNDPNDQYESEADAVADKVMSMPDEQADVQRQEEEEEEVMRQEEEEEEVMRQEEEEEVMMQPIEEDEEMPA